MMNRNTNATIANGGIYTLKKGIQSAVIVKMLKCISVRMFCLCKGMKCPTHQCCHTGCIARCVGGISCLMMYFFISILTVLGMMFEARKFSNFCNFGKFVNWYKSCVLFLYETTWFVSITFVNMNIYHLDKICKPQTLCSYMLSSFFSIYNVYISQ